MQDAVLHVSTIENLRAQPAPQLPPGRTVVIYVLGYYSAGDSGGGLFRWQDDSVEQDDGGLVIQPSSLPATGRWMRVIDGEYKPEWFGAKGDGSNDSTSIKKVFEKVKTAGGGRVGFRGGRSYYLGSYGPDAAAIDLESLENVVIEGNGAELVLESTPPKEHYPRFFRLINPKNVSFRNLRFRDTGAVVHDQRGSFAFWLEGKEGKSACGFSGGVTIDNCVGEKLAGFLTCDGTYDHRLRDILLLNCRVKDAYYGITCQRNGDGLRAINFRCDNVIRAYFPYGVQDHDIELSIHHDGRGVAGATAVCLIKRYAGETGKYDTKGIKLRARFFGSVAKYAHAVMLEHEPQGQIGVIEDIDIDLHVMDVEPPNHMIPLAFTSVGEVGGKTKNRWDKIRISGNLGAFADSPIRIYSEQEIEGRLYMDPSICKSQAVPQPHYPGFVVRVAQDREFRTLQGALTKQTVRIPLSTLDANAFVLKFRVWCHDDCSRLDNQSTTYREDVVVAYNADDGPVKIKLPIENMVKAWRGGEATVLYEPNGEDILVRFENDGYGGPKAAARVEVEYVSRGPMYG